MRGTFTRPTSGGKGGFIPPTGKSYAINMATIGIWNRRHRHMDEEFLFWDNQTFNTQIGLALPTPRADTLPPAPILRCL